MSESLTLYQIESQLLDLMHLREETETSNTLTPAERVDCLKAIDIEIQDYVRREIAKVDGIAAYLRECEARSDALEKEANRLRDKAKAWDAKAERLEDLVISIMQQAGKTHMEGRQSAFGIRKNPPSVQVNQPELVPEEYKRVVITMDAELWQHVRVSLLRREETKWVAQELQNEAEVSEPVPKKDKIATELKRGFGVAGCTLKTDSVRLEIK